MSYTQYQQYGGNPYSSGPEAETGGIGGPEYGAQGNQSYGQRNQAYGGQQSQPHTQYAQQGHELSNTTSTYSQPPGASATTQHTHILSQQDFLSRVDKIKNDIRSLSIDIQNIATAHQQSLNSTDNNSSSARLEGLVATTQLKTTAIRDEIKYLERDAAKSQGSTVKARQAKQVKNEFETALHNYEDEELQYRQRYRDQIARQYKIVNPNATEQEVREASELDWGNSGVFQTAFREDRVGQSSSVLGAVRARHNELQRIEHTLAELGQLFNDMAQVVEVQEPVVQRTEENAIQAVEDIDNANTQLDKGKKSAKNRRKLKWWCFLVVVLIIIAAALGIGLGIGLTRQAAKPVTG